MKLDIGRFGQKLFQTEVAEIDLVNGAEIFIGRSDDCHVALDDQQVSRHHALISFSQGKLILKKLSSLGNLAVNGQEVETSEVREGDKISVADFTLTIAQAPAADKPAEGSEDFAREEPSAVSDEATAILDTLAATSDSEGDAEHEVSEELDGQTPGEEAEPEVFDQESEEDEDEFSNNDPDENETEETAEGFGEEDAFGAEEGVFGADDGFGEGFGGEDADVGFGGDDAGESTQVVQSFAAYYLEIDGEGAPFDKYKIEDKEVFIGRDPEKCQIVLNDPEVSSVHAAIKKSLINCELEDLNSSNGTVFNGSRINKTELNHNDNFQIGSTFFTVKIVSDLIESEKDILMPVEDGQEVEVEEIVEEEVDYGELTQEGDEFSMEEAQEKSVFKRIWKDPVKRKRLLMYGPVGVVVIMLMMPSEEPKPTVAKSKAEEQKTAQTNGEKPEQEAKKTLAPEVVARLEENYALALAKYEAGEYYEAKEYLEVIRGIDPNYKNTQTLHKLVKQGHEELLRLKEEEEAEKERKKRQLKVESLLKKAKEAVDKREVAVAESLFGEILQIDPENMDVPQLKLEIDAYKEEERRKKEEAARKKALRQSMVEALQPGKTLFLKEDWYKAIDRLEKFTRKKGMDEDLIKEATEMLMKSRKNLSSQINPLLGRARSFKEGQDLKRAYETYGEVLKVDPSHEEALNERDKIKENLRTRSMKVYREALIAESLSLFDEAREKFEEVQQISPVNSEYYIKASERLKNYLE